jgi:hypothetical protein
MLSVVLDIRMLAPPGCLRRLGAREITGLEFQPFNRCLSSSLALRTGHAKLRKSCGPTACAS